MSHSCIVVEDESIALNVIAGLLEARKPFVAEPEPMDPWPKAWKVSFKTSDVDTVLDAFGVTQTDVQMDGG